MSTASLIDLLPDILGSRIRDAHRGVVFRRAMRELGGLEDAELIADVLLSDLFYGWGNESWAGKPLYLREIVQTVRSTKGPILECGSGLSTMLLGWFAAKQGRTVWSLEHQSSWRDRIRRVLDTYAVQNVNVLDCPIVSFEHFDWYSVPPGAVPHDIGLVICDGPPGETRGGRIGLLPILAGHFAPACGILVDDTERPAEKEILATWRRMYPSLSVARSSPVEMPERAALRPFTTLIFS